MDGDSINYFLSPSFASEMKSSYSADEQCAQVTHIGGGGGRFASYKESVINFYKNNKMNIAIGVIVLIVLMVIIYVWVTKKNKAKKAAEAAQAVQAAQAAAQNQQNQAGPPSPADIIKMREERRAKQAAQQAAQQVQQAAQQVQQAAQQTAQQMPQQMPQTAQQMPQVQQMPQKTIKFAEPIEVKKIDHKPEPSTEPEAIEEQDTDIFNTSQKPPATIKAELDELE